VPVEDTVIIVTRNGMGSADEKLQLKAEKVITF
jgi:hypothetical protein